MRRPRCARGRYFLRNKEPRGVLPCLHPERAGANPRCRLPSRSLRPQADRLPDNRCPALTRLATGLKPSLSKWTLARRRSADYTGSRADASSLQLSVRRSTSLLTMLASVGIRKGFRKTTVEDFDQGIHVNLRGAFFMSQTVVPHLRCPGRIVNISSIVSRTGGPLYSVYAASKAGLEGFTRSLAAAMGPYGHSVNAVMPGLTDTDILQEITADEESAAFHRGVAAATPMEGRLASPEDIARIVVFMAGPNSHWMTGLSISATGGLLMV